MQKVFVPEPIAASGLDLLKKHFECVAPWEEAGVSNGPLSSLSQKELLYDAEAVIVRLFKVTAGDLDGASKLKVIVKHGVGVDSIDVKAATEKGIPVAYTPTANANAVAEHVIALMFSMARHIPPADRMVREGRFNEKDSLRGVELAGKTLGVIGLGRIGRRVVNKAHHGLGMNVAAYDPLLSPDTYDGPATLQARLEDVLRGSDFLTLHVPLSDATRHLINADSLALMKSTARIVNTSRGAVIDEEALATALNDGRLAGAALDVFEAEPLPADHVLCSAANTILTPHVASSTRDALESMARESAQAVIAVLAGERPEHLVNPDAYA